MVLWARERGHGSFLSEGGRIAGAVALDGVDGFGDGFRGGAPTEAPAGHAPGFGETVHDDGVLEMGGRKAGNALMFGAVVEQVLVNFVAHYEDALFDTYI